MMAAPLKTAGSQIERLQSLQVLRGLAAFAVVVYHTRLILMQQGVPDLEGFGAIAGRGWLGVNLFFVISGFTILHAHRRDIGMPHRATRYIWRRLMRVYPVYWIFLTAYIAAAAAGLGKPDFRYDVGDLASAYLLVPLVEAPTLPLKMAWTLIYEMMFYALFLIPIFNRKVGIAALILWALLIVLDMARADQGMNALRIFNLYFAAGIVVCLVAPHLSRGGALVTLAAAALTTVVAFPVAPAGISTAIQENWPLLVLIVPVALMVLGLVSLERTTTLSFPAPLTFLGNASYSIYLVHSAIISVIAEVNAKLDGLHIPVLLLYIATAIIATVAGAIAHIVIERPLLDLLRKVPIGKPHTATGRVSA